MPSITLKGNPIQVVGEELSAGQKCPDFKLQGADMSDVTLGSHAGKTRVICAVPSLDTPVCDVEMKRFNDEATKNADTVILAVSMDLPFAQKRWCGANNADAIVTGSDHRDASFGQAFGCLVEGGPLDRFLARAVFVVGPDDTLRHVEYVSEIGEEPDYDAALSAVNA